MRWETRDPVLVLAISLGVFVVVAVVLAVAFLFVFRSTRGRRAAGESWRFVYGNAPVQITDTTLSQTRQDGTVTMNLEDVVRVHLVATGKPIVRVGNLEQAPWTKFWVVQIEDRHGSSVHVERLVTSWTVWGTRLVEQGSQLRSILQDLLSRLPPTAEVDPRVSAYAATGKLAPAVASAAGGGAG